MTVKQFRKMTLYWENSIDDIMKTNKRKPNILYEKMPVLQDTMKLLRTREQSQGSR